MRLLLLLAVALGSTMAQMPNRHFKSGEEIKGKDFTITPIQDPDAGLNFIIRTKRQDVDYALVTVFYVDHFALDRVRDNGENQLVEVLRSEEVFGMVGRAAVYDSLIGPVTSRKLSDIVMIRVKLTQDKGSEDFR